MTDFPDGWRAVAHDLSRTAAATRAGGRSRDSRVYGARFILRLDATSETRLQNLVERFKVSRAEVIRHLIVQATLGYLGIGPG